MSRQKTIIFGASVKKLGPLLKEAIKWKHTARAVMYDITQTDNTLRDLDIQYGHMNNKDKIAELAKGFDAVIALHEPVYLQPDDHLRAVKALIEGTKIAGAEKLIVIGHPVNYPVENTLEFYGKWKVILRSQAEALKVLQNKVSLDWYYIHSPRLEPSPVTGRLMLGETILCTSPLGVNNIEKKNYANEVFKLADRKMSARNLDSMLLNI
jgi:putative NADH-flavin reductase